MPTNTIKSVASDFEDLAAKIHADGREKGYAEGWAAAIAYLQKGAPVNGVIVSGAAKTSLVLSGRPAVIMEILQANPGLTSSEILAHAIATGDRDAKPTTVATTLQRLKNRAEGALVRNEDGRWFVNE